MMQDFKGKADKIQNSDDRLIKISPMEGFNPESEAGLVDKRLFQGDNKLHATIDPQTSLWSLKYEKGGLPEPLKQKFTSYKKLMETVKHYFNKRKLKVTEELPYDT